MANVYIINGSPRVNGNTIQMCEKFKSGVESKGLTCEIINLYKLNFTGCRACFACKEINSPNFKKCAFPDDLKDVLDKVTHADGLVLASPIFFQSVTGEMQSFMERIFFPFFTYNKEFKSYPPKMLETAVIYTMNVPKEVYDNGYAKDNTPLANFEKWLTMTYKEPEKIFAFNTLQFSDYSKYASEIFDETAKRKYQAEQFPKDLQNAFDAGIRMANKIIK